MPKANVLVYTEILKNSEQNFAMKHSDTKSLAPGHENEFVNPATAQTLRQVEGSNLQEGGIIVGDAGFGSVEACLHLHKTFNVNGAFVVKGLTYLYPKQVLGAILKARHKRDIGGKWVVMKMKIRETPIIALAYAWGFDLSRVSYFVSTVGNTCAASEPHSTAFQDHNGER